jgi:hypothetical protein
MRDERQETRVGSLALRVASRLVLVKARCPATPSPGSLRSPPSPPRGRGDCQTLSGMAQRTRLASCLLSIVSCHSSLVTCLLFLQLNHLS